MGAQAAVAPDSIKQDPAPADMGPIAPFAGRWTVLRRIDDRRAGQDGVFRGTALFTPAPEGLRYHEDGTLTLGQGVPLRATRDYLWRLDEGRIAVDHGDGRAFHSFDPGCPVAEHLCGRDLYRVEYDFDRWPLWRVIWVVTGPVKDYRMITDYAPSPDGFAPVGMAVAEPGCTLGAPWGGLPRATRQGAHPLIRDWRSAPIWSKGRLSRP